MIYVLDASAFLRYLDNEAGGKRVRGVLADAARGSGHALMSAVNWGEVIHVLGKRHSAAVAEDNLAMLSRQPLTIVAASADRAVRAALIKLKHQIPYADCFGVELASDSSDHILITADFDVKPADQDIRIGFLPLKP